MLTLVHALFKLRGLKSLFAQMAMVFRLVMMVMETEPSKFKAGSDVSNASADGENNAEVDYSNYNSCNNARGEFKADR